MNPMEVLAATARDFGFSAQDLFGRRRPTALSRARFAAAWVLRERFGVSPSRIAALMRKEYGSIEHALGRAEQLRGQCEDFRKRTDALLTLQVVPPRSHPRHPAVLSHRVKPKNEHVDGDTDARMRMHGTMALERALRAARGEAA